MAKLSTQQHAQTQRILLFGPPKSGKTQLAGELAEYYDLIWIDMENGHETLFKMPTAWQERIELINLKDTRSYPIAIETVLKMVKGPVSICEEHGKVSCMICKREETTQLAGIAKEDLELRDSVHTSLFIDVDLPSLGHDKVVVFDSMTQLTNSAMAHITKKEPDDYKMQTDDWGHLAKLVEIFLSHIQQAGYNVVVISHETEAETEGKKKTLVPVAGSRNSSRNSAKAFDHVVYCERKNKKHVFASSTTYATNILTGSRTDVSMETSDAPSLLAIFKPELFVEGTKEGTVGGAVTAKKPAAQTSDILARLKASKEK